jgi:hypothetical protein
MKKITIFINGEAYQATESNNVLDDCIVDQIAKAFSINIL